MKLSDSIGVSKESGKGIFLPVGFILFTALFAGCASGAMDAVNRAHIAIKNAKEIGAEKYASGEMSAAVAAFDLAETSLMEGNTPAYKQSKLYALEAERRALAAKEKAEQAVREEALRPIPAQLPPVPKIVALPRPLEDPAVIKKRYVAVARRRIVNAAITDSGGMIDKGKVELETWIASDGKVVQVLLIGGDTNDPFAQRTVAAIRGIKMDPFPLGIDEKYIKIRVKIDTLGEAGRQ